MNTLLDTLKNLHFVLVKTFPNCEIPTNFSIDQFALENLGKIRFCGGMNDKNFPTTFESKGAMKLHLFESSNIRTDSLLNIIEKAGGIFTGVGGIASILEYKQELPEIAKIFSPNKKIEENESWHNSFGIPYLSLPNNQINYSHNTIEWIFYGNYLLIGEKR